MKKASKRTANYRTGTASRHCGICTMFRRPASCVSVTGNIQKDDLCDYFKLKETDAMRDVKSSPCPDCDGRGYLPDPDGVNGVQTCLNCNGTGRDPITEIVRQTETHHESGSPYDAWSEEARAAALLARAKSSSKAEAAHKSGKESQHPTHPLPDHHRDAVAAYDLPSEPGQEQQYMKVARRKDGSYYGAGESFDFSAKNAAEARSKLQGWGAKHVGWDTRDSAMRRHLDAAEPQYKCTECGGKGYVHGRECPACGGKGFIPESEKMRRSSATSPTGDRCIDYRRPHRDAIYDREFSGEQRKKAAESGAAMKGGGFPINNKSDLANARQALGRAKNRAATIRHIKKRAKALGVKLPENWPGDRAAVVKDSRYADVTPRVQIL